MGVSYFEDERIGMNPVYSQSGVDVYHGDCAKVLPSLGVKADLILTSPPYDDLRTYGGGVFDFGSIADACVGALVDGGVIVWVVGDGIEGYSETGSSFRHALGFMRRGLKLHQTMLYQTTREAPTAPNRYARVHEYMFVFSNGRPRVANIIRDKPNTTSGTVHRRKMIGRYADNSKPHRNYKRNRIVSPEFGPRTNIWKYHTSPFSNANRFDEHPAVFPDALARDHIRTWTNPGDLVIDPMAGSGTTLRAAKDLGRSSIGIEIHENYIDIIERRMAQEVMELE